MPGPQYQPQNHQRYDFGQRHFTGPAADDNRGDGWMSHHPDNQDMAAQYGPYGGGYDMFGYGGYDYYGYAMMGMGMPPYVAPQPDQEAKWGEVQQTTLETLQQAGAVREYGPDTVLVIASGPEDMKQLDHNAEADMITSQLGEERETVVLWNPSPEALEAMLKEGHFKDVVLSGHGEEGVTYMTGADGTAVAVDGKTMAGMFEDSGVQNVVLNMCHGAGGQNSVAQAFAEAGMNAIGWTSTVRDSTAQDMAGTIAALFSDGSSASDLDVAASTNANLDVVKADPVAAALNAAESLVTNLFGGGSAETATADAAAAPAAPAPAVAAPEVAAPVPEMDPMEAEARAAAEAVKFAQWDMMNYAFF